MLEHLKNESNKTFTENLAVTHRSSLSFCLDLFATIGALRNAPDEDIVTRFMRAYTEDRDLAMRILFYARDIRGGLGERRVFRLIMRWLAENYPDSVTKNLERIPEFGRWDDLFAIMDTSCEGSALGLIKSQLERDSDSEHPSLLAKWLPSINASNAKTRFLARKTAKLLGMDYKTYRQTLSKLRQRIDIIENYLRERNYWDIDYSKVPAKAMFKYREAFINNSGYEYKQFLRDVKAGKRKLHTGTLAPYEIIMPILNASWQSDSLSDDERDSINVTWNALEDFTNGENALAVIDGSGSMYMYSSEYLCPAAVALSLGIYFAERNTGTFKNHFITFSETPRLIEIQGSDIYDKVIFCESFNECANTNIQAVFELLLNTALKHHVPQSEMPSTLYIISDMEFDSCTLDSRMTNFEYAKKIFTENGYELPRVVFWNVNSRNIQQPVRYNEQGVCLISGVTPRIFSLVKSGELEPVTITPMDQMLDILNSERYASITA